MAILQKNRSDDMKDKKILNICLLSFAMVALITFILPLKKFELSVNDTAFLKVMFYVLNAILIVSLVTLIVVAIFNLFKDCYKLVKLMETMALVGFASVFLVLLMFASSGLSHICVGYLLVCVEMFFCANFSQMFRLVNSKNMVSKLANSVSGDNQTNKYNNHIDTKDKSVSKG